MSTKRPGLTIQEFLLLVAIVLIGGGIFVMSLDRVRVNDGGGRTQIINNLKQVVLATHSAHEMWNSLPPATGIYGKAKGTESLSVHLLPYIEQVPLYESYAVPGLPMPSTALIPPYNAPLDCSTGDFIRVQNFAANVRVFTDAGINTPYNTDVTTITGSKDGACSGTFATTFTNGSSNLIMYSTRCANNGSIGNSGNVNCSAYDAWVGSNDSAFFGVSIMTGPASATSTGGWQLNPNLAQTNCQFGAVAHSFGASGIRCAMADGSVHQASVRISPETWNRAMQPNVGLPLGTDW